MGAINEKGLNRKDKIGSGDLCLNNILNNTFVKQANDFNNILAFLWRLTVHSYWSTCKTDFCSWQWTRINDKRDDFKFPIPNFPFFCNNFNVSSGLRVYLPHLMHCFIVFTYYLDCIAIRLALSVYIQLEFRSSYKKFQDRYDSLVTHYRLSVSQVSDGILTSSSYINQVLLPWLKQQIMHWLYLNSRYNTSLSFQMHVFKSLFTGVVYLAWDMGMNTLISVFMGYKVFY